MEFQHEPVLLDAVVTQLTAAVRHPKSLNFQESIQIVDATLGGAGHTCAILSEVLRLQPGVRINFRGFDQDSRAIAASTARLQTLAKLHKNLTFEIIPENFRGIANHLGQAEKIDIFLADIGVSSPQLDDPERGFSVRASTPVDMRMDSRTSLDARQLLLTADANTLETIFKNYGEEPRARHLAACIIADRPENKIPLESGIELSRYFDRILGYHNSRSSPSIRIFQALRIAVNDELGALEELLSALPRIMNPHDGIAGVISFHSLEDRAIKLAYRNWEETDPSKGCEFPRGGIVATDSENAKNPRARSARLRVFSFGETRKSARSRSTKV